MIRSVVITGGFGVLGQAATEIFIGSGDKVARIDFASVPQFPIANVLDVGGVDLTDAGATQAAIDKIVEQHGGIDVLVNIAGGFAWETLQGGSTETWTKMLSMNLMSNVIVTKLSLPLLVASANGRIINVGAGAAVKAGAGMGPYAASKSGVHRLTEALADELVREQVTVNAILPSIIDTPTNRADMPDADFSNWVKPDAIADVIKFLASDSGRAITGALIPVTRG
jgi:NAD(P)-dependent dehydrogenase (short-subunit alcohol dehydrogenase family)